MVKLLKIIHCFSLTMKTIFPRLSILNNLFIQSSLRKLNLLLDVSCNPLMGRWDLSLELCLRILHTIMVFGFLVGLGSTCSIN